MTMARISLEQAKELLRTVSHRLQTEAEIIGEGEMLKLPGARALAGVVVGLVFKVGGDGTDVLEAIHAGAQASKSRAMFS